MADLRPTLILADDHPMMIEGLRNVLGPLLRVIETVLDGTSLLEAASRLRPNLVIADVSMPGMDGIEVTRQLATRSPGTKVIILSFHGEASWVRAAFEAGAWGYLTKTAAMDEIETAVRQVLDGHFYVSPQVTRGFVLNSQGEAHGVMPALPGPAPCSAVQEEQEVLTPREQDIVRLVGNGLANKDIARDLGVSVTTVRTHLKNVYEKLGRDSRVELALWAAQAVSAA